MEERCDPCLFSTWKTKEHDPLYVERDMDRSTAPGIDSVCNDGNRSGWEFPAVTGHTIEVSKQLEEILFGPGIINWDLRPSSAHA